MSNLFALKSKLHRAYFNLDRSDEYDRKLVAGYLHQLRNNEEVDLDAMCETLNFFGIKL